jgi:hypothetical protein
LKSRSFAVDARPRRSLRRQPSVPPGPCHRKRRSPQFWQHRTGCLHNERTIGAKTIYHQRSPTEAARLPIPRFFIRSTAKTASCATCGRMGRSPCSAPIRSRRSCSGPPLRLGLDPTQFAAHSLRSGFLTSADAGGAALDDSMDQSGHASRGGAAQYVRHGSPWSAGRARAARSLKI